MYIVLEYLLLENFIINYLILYLTKLITKKDTKNIRLILGAVVASFYSLIYFNPFLIFLSKPLYKFLFSMLIIRFSFKYSTIKHFIRELFSFYIVSFIFAGATIGIFYSSNNLYTILSNNIDIFNGFPIKYLIIGILGSISISKIIFEYYNLRIIRENYIADVTIIYQEKEIKIKALLDTGNSLIDPFTNKRILVVEYERLKEYLPIKMKDLIIANEEFNYKHIEELLTELQDSISLTIIPFKTVGKNGVLFGFKPDSVKIYYMEKELLKRDIIIGIYSGSLSKEMGYSGLLHYELINGGVENEYIEVQN